MVLRIIGCALPCALLISCGGSENGGVPGNTGDQSAYSGIPENAVIALYGTEPFWGGRVNGSTLTYTTPENIAGTPIPVTRFAGRGGLSYSGEWEGQVVDLIITPGECSDGMSDRTYPFNATLQIGGEQRHGCAAPDGDVPGEP